MNNNLALFEEKEIRRIWSNSKWYFSVVDVIYVLTDSNKPRDYWYRMKQRVGVEEKIKLSTICRRLKLKSSDGKTYKTDCADTEGILRIIQSIPSQKAEPFKRWLAKIGSERIEEINNPEILSDRMKQIYEKKGYTKSWIEQREKGIVNRHSLTDEWKERETNLVKDYAILTNEIYISGFGYSKKEYKKIKGLNEEQNLRDYMTNMELALTNLGEVTSVEFHKKNNSYGLRQLKKDITYAGKIVNNAKQEIEFKLERSIITSTDNNEASTKNKEI